MRRRADSVLGTALPIQDVVRSTAIPRKGRAAGRASSIWRADRHIELFILLEMFCAVALLWSGLQELRAFFRIAVFGGSLILTALLSGRERFFHPAVRPTFWILTVIALSILNPGTDTWLAAAAQIAMYVAILGPLFWVPRLRIDSNTLGRALLLIWAFQTLSAGIGILQVYYPGRFQPAISAVVLAGRWHGENLKYINGFGQSVFRPMGLTDYPGGACMAGFYAALLGLGLFTLERRLFRQAIYAFSMIVGITSIYLSQVRSVFVMLCVSALAFVALASRRKVGLPLQGRGFGRLSGVRRINLARAIAVIMVAALAGSLWSLSVGGKSVSDRFSTLTSGSPTQVYQANRGFFLTYTVETLLPQYPLGAGLGRWGMMKYYFGDQNKATESAFWSEIQWTGWLYDGGLPLIAAYAVALMVALLTAYKISLSEPDGRLAVFAAIVFAYDIGAIADTFDTNIFMSQEGLNFWMFNAVLFAAAAYEARLTTRQAAIAAPKKVLGA
jgi:hypothetical protein